MVYYHVGCYLLSAGARRKRDTLGCILALLSRSFYLFTRPSKRAISAGGKGEKMVDHVSFLTFHNLSSTPSQLRELQEEHQQRSPRLWPLQLLC